MRLSKITPWSSPTYSPPKKVDESFEATTKPPKAEDEVSGAPAASSPADDERPPGEPPAHALDITI
jgi:hypothetical protein